MKRLLLCLLFSVLTLGQAATSHAPRCGVELQARKTSADSDWNRVDLNPKATTVQALTVVAAPTHAQLLASANKRFDGELMTYTVQGYLVGYKLENDFDFHIVIADLNDTSITMIVEMVSPTMRQFQLAARADMSESALSRALSERREFSTEERRRVAEILGFDVEWLFQEPQPPARVVAHELSELR